MKPFITSHLNRVLTLILTIIALVMGQNTWADNGWYIQTNTSGNVTTFTITRTNTAVAETVRYRLVNLSAYAIQPITMPTCIRQAPNVAINWR